MSFSGVHGTTGYEWLNVITQALVDGNGLGPLDEIWRQISNQPPKLEPVLKEAKRRVLETLLTSEFTVLTRLLARIASGHYSTRDYSADSLRAGARTLCAAFPGLSHLSDLGRSDGGGPRADFADDREGPRRLVCRRRRHLRFPARYADNGSDRTGPVAAQRAARAPLCVEGAAVHRPRDGEVARGHRVLSLPSPARAQRGRRRSASRRAFHGCLSPDDARPRPGMAAWHDRDRDARYQARRGRACAPDGADGNTRRMGKRGGALEGSQRAASCDSRRDARPVGDLRIHAVSGPARRMAAGPARRQACWSACRPMH